VRAQDCRSALAPTLRIEVGGTDVEEHRAMVGYGDGQMIAAQLSVRRGRSAIEFYKAAFAAVEDYRVGGTDDEPAVVAQLSVGKTSFWVADESPPHDNFSPESLGGSTTRLLLIAEDPQGVIDRAVAAGAIEIYPASE